MTSNPFVKNGYVTPEASLNKLRLLTPHMPERIRGKTALDIASGAVFSARLDELFATLGVPPGTDRLGTFAGWLGDPHKNPHAEALIREFGENLGYTLLALVSGDSRNRPEWSPAQLAYWQGVEDVYLSGGLSYGIIGARLLQAADALLRREGAVLPRLRLAEHGEYLPLAGAYRRGAAQAACHGLPERMVVLDFGHTYVKRGYAAAGRLTVLNSVDSIARRMSAEPSGAGAQLMRDFIFDAICDICSYATAQGVIPALAAVSIANYIDHGTIYAHRGEYGRLAALGGNFERQLTQDLSRELGCDLRVVLIHDGTAAAYGVDCAPNGKSAVITLGTGLGVGFCDMRPDYDKNFSIKIRKI